MDKRLGNIPYRRISRSQRDSPNNQKFEKGKTDRIPKRLAVFVIGLCVLLVSFMPYTYSYFRASTVNQSSSFTATGIDNYLKFTQGTAVAPGGTSLVSRVIRGQLACDFGELSLNSTVLYDNVLVLNNLIDKPLSVSWQVHGGIAAIVETATQAFTLNPTQTVTTTVYQTVYGTQDPLVKQNPYFFGISINATEPGSYEGYLEVRVNGEFLVKKIPMVVVVK